MRIDFVSVPALIEGDKITLIDTHGQVLRRGLAMKDLSNPDFSVRHRLQWEMALRKMITRLKNRLSAQSRSGWDAKATSMASAFRLRAYDLKRIRKWSCRDRYRTKDWPDAIERMWHQGFNCFRHNSATGWDRWAKTTANNQNKRVGGRYMKKNGTVTSTQLKNLIEQQDYRCPLSGRRLTPETSALDHIMPLSRGGEHDISNVHIVDNQVNTAKGRLTVEEFQTLCRDVVTAAYEAPAETAVPS